MSTDSIEPSTPASVATPLEPLPPLASLSYARPGSVIQSEIDLGSPDVATTVLLCRAMGVCFFGYIGLLVIGLCMGGVVQQAMGPLALGALVSLVVGILFFAVAAGVDVGSRRSAILAFALAALVAIVNGYVSVVLGLAVLRGQVEMRLVGGTVVAEAIWLSGSLAVLWHSFRLFARGGSRKNVATLTIGEVLKLVGARVSPKYAVANCGILMLGAGAGWAAAGGYWVACCLAVNTPAPTPPASPPAPLPPWDGDVRTSLGLLPADRNRLATALLPSILPDKRPLLDGMLRETGTALLGDGFTLLPSGPLEGVQSDHFSTSVFWVGDGAATFRNGSVRSTPYGIDVQVIQVGSDKTAHDFDTHQRNYFDLEEWPEFEHWARTSVLRLTTFPTQVQFLTLMDLARDRAKTKPEYSRLQLQVDSDGIINIGPFRGGSTAISFSVARDGEVVRVTRLGRLLPSEIPRRDFLEIRLIKDDERTSNRAAAASAPPARPAMPSRILDLNPVTPALVCLAGLIGIFLGIRLLSRKRANAAAPVPQQQYPVSLAIKFLSGWCVAIAATVVALVVTVRSREAPARAWSAVHGDMILVALFATLILYGLTVVTALIARSLLSPPTTGQKQPVRDWFNFAEGPGRQ